MNVADMDTPGAVEFYLGLMLSILECDCPVPPFPNNLRDLDFLY